MRNSERFLRSYAVVEKLLNEMAQTSSYIPFSQLLTKCAKENRVVRYHQEALKEFNELRNAIVHQRDGEMQIIAEPTDSATEAMEQIATSLMASKEAIHFASVPVRTAKVVDTVEKAFELMRKYHLSRLPVYDWEHFAGMITMENIAEHLMLQKSRKEKLREVLKEEASGKVRFYPKNTYITEIIDLFENSLVNGEPTPMVILTETGRRDEKPLGVISTKDLARILATFM